jgi:hypothetical protein
MLPGLRLPFSLAVLLEVFRSCFSAPSFATYQAVMARERAEPGIFGLCAFDSPSACRVIPNRFRMLWFHSPALPCPRLPAASRPRSAREPQQPNPIPHHAAALAPRQRRSRMRAARSQGRPMVCPPAPALGMHREAPPRVCPCGRDCHRCMLHVAARGRWFTIGAWGGRHRESACPNCRTTRHRGWRRSGGVGQITPQAWLCWQRCPHCPYERNRRGICPFAAPCAHSGRWLRRPHDRENARGSSTSRSGGERPRG